MEPAPATVIAEMRAEYAAAFQRVLQANRKFPEDVKQLEISAYYDPEDDLAIVLFGGLRPCVMFEMHDVLWARLDPETDQIIGFEFPHALALHAVAPEPMRVVVESIVKATKSDPATFLTAPPKAREALAAEAGELVFA